MKSKLGHSQSMIPCSILLTQQTYMHEGLINLTELA